MFEPDSRYAKLTTKKLAVTDADGEPQDIRYLERRLLPAAGEDTPFAEHVVAQGDRLDNITAKYLGDPTQFWRVADANDTFRPEELTDVVGRRIAIVMPR